ncbi:hypothetical protein ACV3R1_13485 [Clostridium perfringens]|uniref:hypothetical protein n=1 Tax=Clostridium perfringens TaxID=1502 RepID=UPI001A1CE99B|nr:hypothetical protein [Clostridium perfringens]MDG6890762.1 hypothetical protein [Clostridium perfringens]HAT4111142.1 hypothetical protein [Clostridium perfringens]
MNYVPDCCYEYRLSREEPKAVEICTECGCNIYAGENYYAIGDKLICYECIENFREEAEEGF